MAHQMMGSYIQNSNRTNFFDWHEYQDHTPNDTNWKKLNCQCLFYSGEFIRRTVKGFGENNLYDFHRGS